MGGGNGGYHWEERWMGEPSNTEDLARTIRKEKYGNPYLTQGTTSTVFIVHKRQNPTNFA
jgi:hypothetical protein